MSPTGTLALAFEIIAIDEASEKFRHIAESAEHTHGGIQKLATYGKAALLGLGTSLVGVGAFSLEMADQFEVSHAKLEAALKANGSNFEELKGSITKADHQMEKFGFTNADTEAALAQFTISLKDPKEGLKQMGLAADLAKFKNIPLADSALVVAKAMNGQLRPLKQLGIDLPIAAGGALKLQHAHEALEKAQQKVNAVLAQFPNAADPASKAHRKYLAAVDGVTTAQTKLSEVQNASGGILKALHERMDGQASAAAKTFKGHIQALLTQTKDLGKDIGLVLIPFLEKLAVAIQGTVHWLQQHTTVAKVLGGVIAGVLGVAIAAYIGQMVVSAASTAIFVARTVLLNATVAIAIARSYAGAAASGAWTAAQWLLNAALTANPIGLVIVAIGLLVAGLVIAWKNSETFREIVVGAFRFAANIVLGEVNIMLAVLEALFRALGHIPGVGGAFRAVANEIAGARGQVRQLHDAINGLPTSKSVRIGVETTYTSVGAQGATSGVGPIKMRAGGGSINAGELYRVGENEPEWFVSDKAGQIMNQRQARNAGLGEGGKSGPQYHLNVQATEARIDEQRAMELFRRMELLHG